MKKGADRGIDGRLIFYDENKAGRKEKQIIFSVKGGGVQVKDVRDLRGVIERGFDGTHIWLGDNLKQRDAGAIEIDERIIFFVG